MLSLRLLSAPVRGFLICVGFLFADLPLRGDVQPDYFWQPKLCSTEELAQELKGKTLDMCWIGLSSHFRFVCGNEQTYFEISFRDLPEKYSDFIARIKDQCIEIDNGKTLIFSYKIQDDGSEEVNRPQSSLAKEHPDEYSYLVTERRVFEDASPKHMSQDELALVIRDKNILFYTGAGLSLASEVPAMNELNQLLGLEVREGFMLSLEKALGNPQEFASKIRGFHEACLFSAPTQAHFALKELAQFKNVRLVTENLDCLHEASGVHPYRIDPHHLRNEIGGVALSKFDYMICIGLSYDDRGFLGWYKQQNPQGKIIALDLNQPSYLGDEDFLVVGDIQEVIPAIHKSIVR